MAGFLRDNNIGVYFFFFHHLTRSPIAHNIISDKTIIIETKIIFPLLPLQPLSPLYEHKTLLQWTANGITIIIINPTLGQGTTGVNSSIDEMKYIQYYKKEKYGF